jgi:hypothetical protein
MFNVLEATQVYSLSSKSIITGGAASSTDKLMSASGAPDHR